MFNPISMVGEKARERKWDRGYQYQNCKNISTPTAPLREEGVEESRGRNKGITNKKMKRN